MVNICTTDYSLALDDAARRMKMGQRQRYCGECAKWRWPEECEHGPEMTEKEFAAVVREAARTRW